MLTKHPNSSGVYPCALAVYGSFRGRGTSKAVMTGKPPALRPCSQEHTGQALSAKGQPLSPALHNAAPDDLLFCASMCIFF